MLITFGHGTASAEQIAGLLRGAEITAVVDIRIAPGSRRNPHVARAELERWLPDSGICYRWERRLGGQRTAAPGSPDTAWREAAFRGYAEHMRQPEFLTAIDGVIEQAARQRTVVMCSESDWRRCHRRLVADFATTVLGEAVLHLNHDSQLDAHALSPGLRVREDGLLVYDGGQPQLPWGSFPAREAL